MIARIVLALIVVIVVGLLLSALLGPILIGGLAGVPIAVVIGEFFVRWGWALGLLAGLWYFFVGGSTWPIRRP